MKKNESMLKNRINSTRSFRKKQVKYSFKISPLIGVMCFTIIFFAIGICTKNYSLAFKVGALVGVGVIAFIIIWTMVFSYFDFLISVKKFKKEFKLKY